MMPIDNEFLMLYALYLSILIVIIFAFRSAKYNRQAYWHLFFYAVYTGLMISIFWDEKSFQNGNSLLVLFYGFVFPMLHFMIFAFIRIVKSFGKKS